MIDDLAALAIVMTGLGICVVGDFDKGWKLLIFGAGYLFGKGNPLRRIGGSG